MIMFVMLRANNTNMGEQKNMLNKKKIPKVEPHNRCVLQAHIVACLTAHSHLPNKVFWLVALVKSVIQAWAPIHAKHVFHVFPRPSKVKICFAKQFVEPQPRNHQSPRRMLSLARPSVSTDWFAINFCSTDNPDIEKYKIAAHDHQVTCSLGRIGKSSMLQSIAFAARTR